MSNTKAHKAFTRVERQLDTLWAWAEAEAVNEDYAMPDLNGCFGSSAEFNESCDPKYTTLESDQAFARKHIAVCAHCADFDARFQAGEIDNNGILIGSVDDFSY